MRTLSNQLLIRTLLGSSLHLVSNGAGWVTTALVAILLLLVTPMPSSSQGTEADANATSVEEEIVLGPRSRLVVDIGGARTEYGPGDRVRIRWTSGVLYLNDQQVRPVPERVEAVWPVEETKNSYGSIPIVTEYVREHRGEATEAEVWMRAVKHWGRRVEGALEDARVQYDQLVQSHVEGAEALDRDDAAHTVAEALREQTDLISSVTVESTSFPESPTRTVIFILEGREGVPIHGQLGGASGPQQAELSYVQRTRFNDYYSDLKLLTNSSGEMTIVISEGGVTIDRISSQFDKEVKQ